MYDFLLQSYTQIFQSLIKFKFKFWTQSKASSLLSEDQITQQQHCSFASAAACLWAETGLLSPLRTKI